MPHDKTPAELHPTAHRAMTVALVRGVDQPPRRDWWSDGWDIGLHLFGNAARPLEDEGRAGLLTFTRDRLASRHPELDDDRLLRVLGGAVLLVLEAASARSGNHGPAPLHAALILLGLAPSGYYDALVTAAGDEPWPPTGQSRSDIVAALRAVHRPEAARQLERPVDPDVLTTRRVLASYVDTKGEKSFDAYARPDRQSLRAVADALLTSTNAALDDTETTAALVARVAAASVAQQPALTPLRPVARDWVTARDLPSPGRTRQRGRRALAGLLVAGVLVAAGAAILSFVGDSPDPTPEATPERTGRPVPLPPVPGPDAPAGWPTLTGSLSASNVETRTESVEGWIEAATDELLSLAITLTNEGGTQMPPSTLRTRAYRPNDQDGTVVVYLTTQVEGGPETVVAGARLAVETPSPGNCQATSFESSTLVVEGDGTAPPLRPTNPARRPHLGQSAPYSTIWMASYSLPSVPAGGTVNLRGALHPRDFGAPVIDGSSPRVKVVGTSRYRTAVESAVGETLRVSLSLHNSSCSRRDAEATVRMVPRFPEPKRGYLWLRTVARHNGHPDTTRFEPMVVNLVDSVPATLELVPGTTELWEGTCGSPVITAQLPDDVATTGVRVSVPGYVPRAVCETHIRYITTEFRVVAR